MDHGIDLVQAYLRVNGFFTVAEFPILERGPQGRFREATDIDILAIRRPEAGRVLPRGQRLQGEKVDVDPELQVRWGRTELIVAEVKEGVADANPSLRRPGVLYEALRRFGVVDRDELKQTVQALRTDGEADLDGGRVQMLVFGSRPPEHAAPWRFVPLGHVVAFLRGYLRHQQGLHGQTRARDPALAFLALLDKATQADSGSGSR